MATEPRHYSNNLVLFHWSKDIVQALDDAKIFKYPNIEEKFSWKKNPAVQNFLDVISSILANEYIETVMRNPDAFSNKKKKPT